MAPSLCMCGESIEMAVQFKDEQSHDVAPSLYSTAISIDSPHIRKDGAKYLNLLFESQRY